MTDTPLQIREREARELLRSVQSRRSCDVPSERVVSIGCAVAAVIAAVAAERERAAGVCIEALRESAESEQEIVLWIEAAIRNPEGGS